MWGGRNGEINTGQGSKHQHPFLSTRCCGRCKQRGFANGVIIHDALSVINYVREQRGGKMRFFARRYRISNAAEAAWNAALDLIVSSGAAVGRPAALGW